MEINLDITGYENQFLDLPGGKGREWDCYMYSRRSLVQRDVECTVTCSGACRGEVCAAEQHVAGGRTSTNDSRTMSGIGSTDNGCE